MAVLESRLDVRSDAYRENRARMLDALAQLDDLYAEAAQGGGEEAMARLRSRDKMPLRERISLVLDRDSPFLEISPLAAWRSNYAVGSGFIVGIGVIENTECVILGHDPSVRAGAFNQFNSKKLMRGLEIARENRLPYVQFVESAGADLRGEGGRSDPEASIRREITHFAESGRLFYEITELSKMRIPTISVVFGASTAGGAYQPGMSDYNIFIKGQSRVALGGPPLVKMATGEDADYEELAGADMHTPHIGPRRLPGAGRTRRHTHVPGSRGAPQLAQTGPRTHDARRRSRLRSGRTARHRQREPARPLRHARSGGARRRRVPLRGVQTALRPDTDDRLDLHSRLSDRRPRQQRPAHVGVLRKRRAVHPALQPDRRANDVPAQHHRLYRRHGLRAPGHHQARLQDDQRGGQFQRTSHLRHRRRFLWCPGTTA